MNAEYQQYRQKSGEYGTIEEIRHPMVFIQGLPNVSTGEIVILDNGIKGQVTALKDDRVEAMILSPERIVPGIEATRTGAGLSICVGPEIKGAVLNPLGRPIDGGSPAKCNGDARPVDITPPHISFRHAITQTFYTGTTVIDMLVPLAHGQREVVLGDPTTGKNSFLLTTVSAHAERGIVVYASIGKPWNDIRKVHNFINQSPHKDNIIHVISSAEDILSLIYLTPFTAMTIAEYWRDQGQNVLVILDDLSTHAKYYREMGLLSKRFPSRESYPGDIFYVHARLLERAGNYKHEEKGEAAITCLPVAETVKEDFSGYIVSNLIGITDGHLFFDENIFSQGRRPAINVPLSVTRVGGHTQTTLVRQLHRKLVVLMNKHSEAQGYTHFGAELPESMQRILDAGNALNELLSQPLFYMVPFPVQVIMSAMIWLGWVNGYADQVSQWRENLIKAYEKKTEVKNIFDHLIAQKNLDEFVKEIKANREAIFALCRKQEASPKK